MIPDDLPSKVQIKLYWGIRCWCFHWWALPGQGEVVKVDGENVTVDFLKPVFLKQNNEESS